MEKSSCKKWCEREHRQFIVELKKRNLPVMYGGKPTLRNTPQTKQLAEDLNKMFNKGRSVLSLTSRFVDIRDEHGWPEAYDRTVDAEHIDEMNDNQTKARATSDNGWIMIDVAAFQHYYADPSLDLNEALMKARVDQ